MKLGLGTVQFGMDYGVSNAGGRTPEPEVELIITAAREAGVRVIDTAPAYGDAEQIIGRVGVEGFDVVTKTEIHADAARLGAGFARSLARLGVPRVHGLIVHDVADLLDEAGPSRFEKMCALRDAGLVSRIGASVYTSEQLAELLDRFEVDLVQVPVNVFDQRMLADGTLAGLKERGIEVHARSAFLQGLLLMEPDDIPDSLAHARPLGRRWREWVAEAGLTPVEAALGFVVSIPFVDVVVCGVNTVAHFRELFAAYGRPVDPSDLVEFASGDSAIIDPTRWRAAS